MKILVLNCGSSSIKYQLFEMNSSEVIAKGIIEKIGLSGSFLKHTKQDGEKVKLVGDIVDHTIGIEYILGVLVSEKHGCLKSLNEIEAVGHRVVHGGEKFNDSVIITDKVIDEIEACVDLAPLHNPPNLQGINAMKSLLPDVQQVAVFDTAFHQTMPDYAYTYAIPYSLYKKYGLRRYGFHGTSHKYVSQRACEILGKDYKTQKIISCHLGGGASVAAIKNGESIDTSMGLTPLEGMIMGTRSGDVDLGVLTFIMNKEDIDVKAANALVNKHSGVLGITGISSDMRDIENASAEGNERAKLALEMYDYRIKKYIGAYSAAMGGCDIIIFTGGVGENGDSTRAGVCQGLEYLGVELDSEINSSFRAEEKVISKPESKVTLMVVPTNEELMIARDTLRLLN
ncbi:acetate/propionate family kinase [Aureibacter tunicatorum]|uniref:Acetate kinase n=1 Tax=Aureibacter tunicatorum TaxID=866807 RepID=A0AAE3XQ88_9BACT|nr:acetate kinase [Aureibacter tunicatorum]MDR6239374.1 acetate kinase [Aureibacter tunicatorum]BDD04703.1 acetate kinase [Aureibacter tunicatorum]